MEYKTLVTGDDLVRILDADAVAAAELDPLRQSGFFGDATTWEAHRRPMLHAVDRDGSFLDVGCASGYLLECVVQWAALGGRALEPFGVDVGPQLVELAKRRLPQWADRFFVGDAREWTPPMRFDFVCTTPYPDFSGDRRPHVERLIREYAAPGGRLILRTYFTVTGTDVWNSYFDNAAFLRAQGFEPSGSSASDPVGAEYVWVDLISIERPLVRRPAPLSHARRLTTVRRPIRVLDASSIRGQVASTRRR